MMLSDINMAVNSTALHALAALDCGRVRRIVRAEYALLEHVAAAPAQRAIEKAHCDTTI